MKITGSEIVVDGAAWIRSAVHQGAITMLVRLTALAILSAAPAWAGERSVTVKGDALIEIDFLALEPSARAAGGDAKDYYREVAEALAAHGGELVGVFDVFRVSNGIIHPESVGVIQWPDADAAKAFKAEIDASFRGARIEVWRNFYTLAPGPDGPSDLTLVFDDDKIYEFVTLLPNPVHGAMFEAFAAAVSPVAAKEFTRRSLAGLVPTDPVATGLASDLRTSSGALVQWDDVARVEAWMRSDFYVRKAAAMLDPATDRRELIWTRPARVPQEGERR